MPRKTKWRNGLLSSYEPIRTPLFYSGVFQQADTAKDPTFPSHNSDKLFVADHSSLPAVGYTQQFSSVGDSLEGFIVPRLHWDGAQHVQDGGLVHVRQSSSSSAVATNYGWTGSTFSSAGEEQPEDNSMDTSNGRIWYMASAPNASANLGGSNGPYATYAAWNLSGYRGDFQIWPNAALSITSSMGSSSLTTNGNSIKEYWQLRAGGLLYRSTSYLEQAVAGDWVRYERPNANGWQTDPITYKTMSQSGLQSSGLFLLKEGRLEPETNMVPDGGAVLNARIVADKVMGGGRNIYRVGPRLYTLGDVTNTDNNLLRVTYSFDDSLTCTATEFDTFVTSITQDGTANISATQTFSDVVSSPTQIHDYRFNFTGGWSASGELQGSFFENGVAGWSTSTASRFVQLSIHPEHWSEMSSLSAPKIYIFGKYQSGTSYTTPTQTTRNGYTITHTGYVSGYLSQPVCAYYVPSLSRAFATIPNPVSNLQDLAQKPIDMTAAAKEHGLF